MNKRMFMHSTEYGLTHGIYAGQFGRNARDAKATTVIALETARVSQVILFDIEQVKVFWDLICSKNFLPSVEYRLPFASTWLQFSSPIKLDEVSIDYSGCAAMLLYQALQDPLPVLNRLYLIHEEDDLEMMSWFDGHLDSTYVFSAWTERFADSYRLLAAACIQYINCENVYLEKQGEVSEAVNRKREAKGKSRLEPYYVCRIKGVQYDSHATGEGSKHGIRYDVRGHFRRMETGKTIWVRAHQRGLQNELYVPKVYKVSKGLQTPTPNASGETYPSARIVESSPVTVSQEGQ